MSNYLSSMMSDYFQIDWESIKSDLKSINAKILLIELPEGLKQFIPEIDENLKNFITYYSGENVYGSCDTYNFNINVDAILHFGHAPIPNLNYFKKTFFIELKRKIVLNENLIKSIQKLKCKRVGLLGTVQYLPLLNDISQILNNNGIETIISKGDGRLFYPGQVLGCDFSAAEKIQNNVDCFIVLADGEFHAQGIALSTYKDTYAIEPVSGNITKIEADKILKSRYIQIERFRDSKNVGILVSTKIGQYRISLAKKIKEKIQNNGKKAYIILMNEILPQKLMNLNFDAYINTACPRIAMDDNFLYEKPVLTPEEMEIALGIKNCFPYSIDRINFVDQVGKDI